MSSFSSLSFPVAFSGSVMGVLATMCIAGSMLSISASPALAKPDAPAAVVEQATSAISEYVHYVKIARYDLANAFGQSVIDAMAKPIGKAEGDAALTAAQFCQIVESSGQLSRFEDAIARGGRISEIELVSSTLANAFATGKMELARNADQITKNIELLAGTQRQRLVARERLATAGEYAVPQLLSALNRRDNPALSGEIRQLLVDMGRQAARPLQAALGGLDAVSQEFVAGILGDARYSSSVPYLYELAASSSNASVQASASRAITKLTGSFNPTNAVATSFNELSKQYASGAESLIPFTGEATQPVWMFDASTGLRAVPVKAEVFQYVMAMHTAERALKADPNNRQALASWVAASFNRELRSPKDYVEPVYKDKPEAMYYAAAAGPSTLDIVLNGALASKDVPLARKVIAAMSSTTGAASLASDASGLSSALVFPNRRVRTDAALALASMGGSSSFAGSERVVPTLAAAVQDVAVRNAIIVADNERSSALADRVKAMGFTVLAPALGLADAQVVASTASSVDLIVTSLPLGSTLETVSGVRGSSQLAATPVLALTDMDGALELGRAFDRDGFVRIARLGISAEDMAGAVAQLTESSLGAALSVDEASEYQSRALAALRDVALAGNSAMPIADATSSLVGALAQAKGNLKPKIADVLGRINDKRAQEALALSALGSSADEMPAILGSLGASGRRFGNLLDQATVSRLVDAAGKAEPGAVGTALSSVLGALNVSTDRVVPLILK